MKKSNAPFVYILNWNGSMFGGVLNTRWSCGVQTQAKGKYSKMITLGQQLNLPKLQCYLDYMGAFDDLDQLGIATSEVMPLLNVADGETEVNPHFGKVKYHTLTAKSDWQFAPSWNASVGGHIWHHYRMQQRAVAQLSSQLWLRGHLGVLSSEEARLPCVPFLCRSQVQLHTSQHAHRLQHRPLGVGYNLSHKGLLKSL